mgnify:FL=1
MSQVLTIVHRVISTFLIKRARMTVKSGAQSGAVTLIQRFGSALNLNLHFHMLYLNGVYDANGQRIGIITGLFDRKSEYRIRSVACLFYESV